jgi:hypothetical protein
LKKLPFPPCIRGVNLLVPEQPGATDAAYRNMITMLQKSLRDVDGLALFSLTLDVEESTKLGLYFPNAQAGDIIAIVLGRRYPVVVRPRNDHYELIGEAFVHGYMDGGVVGKLPEVDITLRQWPC